MVMFREGDVVEHSARPGEEMVVKQATAVYRNCPNGCRQHITTSVGTLRYKGRPLRTESIKIDASRYGKAIQRALDVAWRRDENGWASRWRKRAAGALEKLGGAR